MGNIAGDGLEHRDACLEIDAAHKIIRLLEKFPHDTKLLENSVWTLQNLVAKKPAPFWNQIEQTLPLFIKVIKDFGTTDLQYHALWGICYISASYTVDVLQSGCVPTLVQYLASDQHRLIFPALQSLGNLISTTKDQNTDEVLRQPDFLPNLFNLCSSTNQRIRVYATWAVSNIAAGTPQQIAKIIEKPEYVESLNAQLKDPEEKIRYQASCALANLMFRATIDQIETLVTKHQYLDGLLEVMKQEQPRTYERNFVEPINRIATLDVTRQFTPIFKNKGLIEQMQSVANSLSFEMRTMSNDIINKYFTGPQAQAQPVQPVQSVQPVQPVQAVPASTTSASAAAPATGSASKNKAPKPQLRKKIAKVNVNDPADAKKKLIKRTKTMLSTIEEAKGLLKGMKKGGRTRKSSKPAEKKKVVTAKKAEKSPQKKRGLKRTNTMKQTLSEAKKILKQIDAVKKTKK